MKKAILALLALSLLTASFAGCKTSLERTPDTTAVTTSNIPEYNAEDANPASDFKYNRNKDGGITINRYIGSDTDVVIPEKIDGKDVTQIESMAFWRGKGAAVTSVMMPDTITEIRGQAFAECSELTTVRLSQNLKTINGAAFEKCEKLSNIVLPDSLTKIGTRAFINCKSLKHINIPAQALSEYSWESFCYAGLETIEFADGVTMIPESAFLGTQIKELVIPDSVKEIRWQAFAGCENLKKITLPEGVEILEAAAFSNCPKLTEVTIPASVKTMSERTFAKCPALKKITFQGDAPADYISDENVLLGVGKASYTIYYQKNAKGFTTPLWNGYKAAPVGSEPKLSFEGDYGYITNADGTVTITEYIGNNSEIVIPAEIESKAVTEIARLLFYNNNSIVSVKMPDTITEIGAGAFTACAKLTTVELSRNLKILNACSFFACDLLSSITLPDTLTQIGSYAFSNCGSLTQIRIPKSVTVWGVDTFGFSGLETIELEEGLASIGDSAFAGTKITEIVVPGSVKNIGTRVFNDCRQLASITLNDGLISIGDYTFESMSALKELVIPASVTDLTEVAFNCCYGLEKLYFAGDAPANFFYEDRDMTANNVDFTVYYREGAKGFSFYRWDEYPLEIWK